MRALGAPSSSQQQTIVLRSSPAEASTSARRQGLGGLGRREVLFLGRHGGRSGARSGHHRCLITAAGGLGGWIAVTKVCPVPMQSANLGEHQKPLPGRPAIAGGTMASNPTAAQRLMEAGMRKSGSRVLFTDNGQEKEVTVDFRLSSCAGWSGGGYGEFGRAPAPPAP